MFPTFGSRAFEIYNDVFLLMSRPMAAVESVTTVEDRKEKMCPSEEDGVLNETSAPLDLSEFTSSQYGIPVQSFTAAPPSSTRKGKVPKCNH